MKKNFIILLIISCVLTQEKFYDRRYDYYDIDQFVENPRLLKKYLDCFLDRGPCTPVGRVFRAVLPEIVRTACSKCSPSQKRFARRTFEAFQRYSPESHSELKKKLDPQNKYFTAFETVLSRS